MSVSGEGKTLDDFKTNHLSASTTSRFANVHGYYHGGDALKETLEDVMKDVERQRIRFPTWDSLKVPVRSSLDGKYLESTTLASSLLEAAVQSILIDRVDWNVTSDLMIHDALDRLHQDSRATCRVLALGPNSSFLLRGFKGMPDHPRLEISKTPVPSSDDGPSPNDIAIVGMSVDFPSGKGTAELWDTMEKGLNVVQEVRELAAQH